MIHIAKSKTGFIVATIADNGEVLNSTEVLTTKEKCWMNIKSCMYQYISNFIQVQDDCTSKSKLYNVTRDGKVITKSASKLKLATKYTPNKK